MIVQTLELHTVSSRLKGRVAAVTGGSRGFGRAMALTLAANGVHVVVGSISLEECEAVAAEISRMGGSAVAQYLDVTRSKQCEAFVKCAVEEFGTLDIMMCNAGIGLAANVLDLDLSEWRRTIDVNLTGVFNCARAAARQMIAAKTKGAMVFTSSNAAQVSFEGLAAYGAAKSAVNQLVRSLAAEFGPHGIRVNAIAPGWTTHRMEGNEERADPDLMSKAIDRTPLRRVGEVREIVEPAIFLASEAASFITGTVLCVDGGYTAV